MKTTELECVTREEYLEHLLGVVQRNHRTSKAGNKHGGIRATAALYGEAEGAISMVINGGRNPSKKMLAHDGLEERRVYVKIKGE